MDHRLGKERSRARQCRIMIGKGGLDSLICREECSCWPESVLFCLWVESRENIQDGKVAIMTLPTPWYSPRNKARLLTAFVEGSRKRRE